MIVTAEHICLNPKLDELNDVKKNTGLEHDKKYGEKYCRRIEVRCNLKFFDKKKNKTKKFTIYYYHIHLAMKKTIIVSQRRYEINKPNKLTILIEGNFYKKIKNTYSKCNLPILWRIIFLKLANNREYILNYCNRFFDSVHQQCPEWFFLI